MKNKKFLEEPKTDHYFSRKPTAAPKPRLIGINLGPKNLRFQTSSSMFSPKKVDNATVLLIEYMRPGKKVLDLGCGYGPIGISIASVKPECSVTMAEINERAANLARTNLSINGIVNARVVESDFFENLKNEKFDTILMNPPMAIGMQRLFMLIEECKAHLLTKGTLQIVSRHNKGGARLEARMKEVFGNVQTLAKGGGFRVYMSLNSK